MERPGTQRRLRVCLVFTHFAEYGFELAKALADHVDLLLVASIENTAAELGQQFLAKPDPSMPTHFIRKTRRPWRLWIEAKRLRRVVQNFGPDLIHIQEDSKDALALALLRWKRIPTLLTVHDPKPHSGADARSRRRTRHGLYIAQLRRRASAAVVHGNALVNDARALLPGRPIYVLPHGPLGLRFGHADPEGGEPGRCLFFGRIEAYKGLRHFVEAMRRLRDRGLPVVGVIAGRGSDLETHRASIDSDPALFELIERFLTPTEVAEQFLRADIVVMPYENATQSGVAAYALSIGRPVVAFDVGAIGEAVLHGLNGLLAPPGDIDQLTDLIANVIEDRSLRRRLASGALERGRGECSWPRIAEGLLPIYRELAHRPGR